MANLVQGLFTRPIITGDKPTQRRKAAEGLSQVFATILSRQMREATTAGEQEHGPLGSGGGASGSIYGSFMDDAISKLLARSPAMQPLNRSLVRALAGPDNPSTATLAKGQIRALEQIDRVLFTSAIHNDSAVPFSHAPTALSPLATQGRTSADALGPRILPPPPEGLAPNLLPPSRVEG